LLPGVGQVGMIKSCGGDASDYGAGGVDVAAGRCGGPDGLLVVGEVLGGGPDGEGDGVVGGDGAAVSEEVRRGLGIRNGLLREKITRGAPEAGLGVGRRSLSGAARRASFTSSTGLKSAGIFLMDVVIYRRPS
jgi:hypothetical protein